MPRKRAGSEYRFETLLARRLHALKRSLQRKDPTLSRHLLEKLRDICPDVVEEALLCLRGNARHRRKNEEVAEEETWEELVAKTEGESDGVAEDRREVADAGSALDAEWASLPSLDQAAYAALFNAAEAFMELLVAWRETVVTGAVFAFVESRVQSVSVWIRQGSEEMKGAWAMAGSEAAQREAFRRWVRWILCVDVDTERAGLRVGKEILAGERGLREGCYKRACRCALSEESVDSLLQVARGEGARGM